MKYLTGTLLMFLCLVSPAMGQLLKREYTNAKPPASRALDRVNLKLAWRAWLPVSTRRDGIYSIQFADKQILIQTLRGYVVALDAETGTIDWKIRVGRPFTNTNRLGFNKKSVITVRGDHMYSINRSSGKLEWKFIMPTGASTAPIADEETVYIGLGPTRVHAFEIPDLVRWQRKNEGADSRSVTMGSKASLDLYSGSSGIAMENLAAQRKDRGPEPEPLWEYLFEAGRLILPPIQTPESIALVALNGTIFSVSKAAPRERFRFKSDSPVFVPMGQHGDMAYIGTEDFNVYAMNVTSKKLMWTFVAGATIIRKPEVTDKDVFVVAGRRGMYRLDRRSGNSLWLNREAFKFLATNTRFVYALDSLGRLMVLDRKRGLKLGTLDTRSFVVPASNEWNDRLFLAAHNGLLVCLHDHNQRTPLVVKKVIDRKVRPRKDKDGKKPMDDKKKDDDKKDDDKDKKDKD